MKPDIRDKARSPHKIAEYFASGNPVISTEYGELKHYFVDGKNALLSKHFEIDLYTEKMNFVISNADAAIKIGKAGKEIGQANFHYQNYIENFKNFLLKL